MNDLYINWQSSVAIVTGYGLDIWGSIFLSVGEFYLYPLLRNRVLSPSLSVSGNVHQEKATGSWKWPLISIYCQGLTSVPHTSEWYGT
jgi:hypothetical protein